MERIFHYFSMFSGLNGLTCIMQGHSANCPIFHEYEALVLTSLYEFCIRMDY